MSVHELKQEILTAIDQTEDEAILEEVHDLLYRDDDDTDKNFKLTEGMRAAISAGLDDLANGRVIPHEEAEKELDRWFEEEAKKWGEK